MAALVLFGGGGDLAMRMLLPSLYFLEHDGLLPDGLKIVGAARSDESREEYVAKVRAAVEGKAHAEDAWSDASWARLDARLDYLPVDATDPASLKPLKANKWLVLTDAYFKGRIKTPVNISIYYRGAAASKFFLKAIIVFAKHCTLNIWT